jgi:hypothetical protein
MRIENDDAREFYIQETIEGNWSTRQLDRQINSLYYERVLMSRKEGRTLVKQEAEDTKEEMQPSHIIKDPYVLEFLDMNANTDFYVKFFEDQVKQESDNSTIGLILCTEKDNTIVKYSVLSEGKQIFASKYKLYLPDEETLKEEIKRERDLLEREQSLRKK